MNNDDDVGFWSDFLYRMLPWIVVGGVIGAAIIFALGGW